MEALFLVRKFPGRKLNSSSPIEGSRFFLGDNSALGCVRFGADISPVWT
jgi:hypothetical protein